MGTAISFSKVSEPLSTQAGQVEKAGMPYPLDPTETYTLTISKTAVYLAGVMGSLYCIGPTKLLFGLFSAQAASMIGRQFSSEDFPLNDKLWTGAAIATASAMFGFEGAILSTAAASYLFANPDQFDKLMENTQKIFKESAPQMKQFGQTLLERAGISVQQINPRGD